MTQPLQGARLRWDEDGRPPVVFDQTWVVDIEAAGGVVSRNVEQRGAATPMLPPEQRILQEDVRTPPRKETYGHGSHRAPEHHLPPGGTRVVPQFFTDIRARDVGPDRQSDSWSPGERVRGHSGSYAKGFGGYPS